MDHVTSGRRHAFFQKEAAACDRPLFVAEARSPLSLSRVPGSPVVKAGPVGRTCPLMILGLSHTLLNLTGFPALPHGCFCGFAVARMVPLAGEISPHCDFLFMPISTWKIRDPPPFQFCTTGARRLLIDQRGFL